MQRLLASVACLALGGSRTQFEHHSLDGVHQAAHGLILELRQPINDPVEVHAPIGLGDPAQRFHQLVAQWIALVRVPERVQSKGERIAAVCAGVARGGYSTNYGGRDGGRLCFVNDLSPRAQTIFGVRGCEGAQALAAGAPLRGGS